MELNEWFFVVASTVAVILGVAGIVWGSTVAISTVSVVLIIAGVVFFLLAVGLYFAEDEGVEAGQKA